MAFYVLEKYLIGCIGVLHFFYKQLVYKQLTLGTQSVKQLLGWIIFSKQQYKISDIPIIFSECSAAFY